MADEREERIKQRMAKIMKAKGISEEDIKDIIKKI